MTWGKDLTSADMLAALKDLDELVTADGYDGPEMVLLVVGGSALLLQGETSRKVSRDIDVIDASPNLLPYIQRLEDINTDARVYDDCLPYNYQDRLRLVHEEFDNFIVVTPSLEDLVVMKLCGGRGNDEEDLNSEELVRKIDWDLLDELVLSDEEARVSILAEIDYYQLLLAYREYRSKYGPAYEPPYQWSYELGGRKGRL